MKILVDADACPVKEIISKIGKEKGIQVLMVASVAHQLVSVNDIEKIIVDNLPQAVDMAITNRVQKGDIVVTGDFGLAVLVLGKEARAISPRGYIFREENLDRLLLQRHIDAKIRRGGGKTRGPKAFTQQDRARFEKNLRSMLEIG